MPITNLNIRLLTDGSLYFTYEVKGSRYDGSAPNWEVFVAWLSIRC